MIFKLDFAVPPGKEAGGRYYTRVPTCVPLRPAHQWMHRRRTVSALRFPHVIPLRNGCGGGVGVEVGEGHHNDQPQFKFSLIQASSQLLLHKGDRKSAATAQLSCGHSSHLGLGNSRETKERESHTLP